MNTTVIHNALSQYGVKEHFDAQNPEILKYFYSIGKTWITNDETAWCSAFANWVAKTSNKSYSGALIARSWLDVGIPTHEPTIGDVVIFWRESKKSWKGHVGFFMGYSEDRKYIYCLGGNQNNQVNIKPYPTFRLLGFRTLQDLCE